MSGAVGEVEALKTPVMLDNKYRLESLLAVGGMGAVYKGRHTLLQKTVAIKILKRELRVLPDLVARFQREAIAASQIGHEGIVEVTDIGTSAAGDPFLVMEFLTGEDLATCLRANGPMPMATAARVCLEVLNAIAAAHDKGIVHRDLKPENVFVAQQARGEVLKVVDFGISRMSAYEEGSMRLTTTGQVMGTPYYMSPEQAVGERNIGVAVDIYAVGVILYELLTGAVPFKSTNYNALLHQILDGKYQAASTLATIPPEFETIISQAMAFEPKARFQDARSFADALAPWAEHPPSRLLPESFQCETVDQRAPNLADQALSSAPTQAAVEEAIEEAAPVEVAAPTAKGKGRIWIGLAVVLLAGLGIAAATLLGGTSESTSSETSSSVAVTDTPAMGATEHDARAPEQLSTIALRFVVAPKDAEVLVNGVVVKTEVYEVPRSTEQMRIEVRKEGFDTQVQHIQPTRDQTLPFALTAAKTQDTEADPSATPNSNTKPSGRDKKPGRNSNNDGRFVEDSPYD